MAGFETTLPAAAPLPAFKHELALGSSSSSIDGSSSNINNFPQQPNLQPGSSSSSSTSHLQQAAAQPSGSRFSCPPGMLCAQLGSLLCGSVVCSPAEKCVFGRMCCPTEAEVCGSRCCPVGYSCFNGVICGPPGAEPCGPFVCQPPMRCYSGMSRLGGQERKLASNVCCTSDKQVRGSGCSSNSGSQHMAHSSLRLRCMTSAYTIFICTIIAWHAAVVLCCCCTAVPKPGVMHLTGCKSASFQCHTTNLVSLSVCPCC